MEKSRVRISDIAEELGLSTATVSNVLHGKTKKVSDRTVQRVLAALEERQYIPSMAAILLAQNTSSIIGVVIHDHEKYESHVLEDGFISMALNSLCREIEKNNLFMMVKQTKDPEEIIRFASMWNVEGLVLIGFCRQDYTYLRNHMRIPFVIYDGYGVCGENICNIGIDNFGGGFQLGNHFREKGHEKALCIADNQICMDWQRYEGFCAGLKGQADFMKIPMERKERLAFYENRLKTILSYSAVFAVSDFYAIELMKFLMKRGVKVPDHMAVAGFDDTPICGMLQPALTTIHQDAGKRAAAALKKLRDLKENRKTESEVLLPVELIKREST